MKQTYGTIGIMGLFLLLLGVAGAYAYNNDASMMGNNQAAYIGMMNDNGMMDVNENYIGMMGNIDNIQQMDAMPDAYMGINDEP